MTKVIVAIGLLCILLGAGMSFVINVKPEEGDLLLSDFQQGDEIVVSENPRFKNLQEVRLRDKLYAFIKDENQDESHGNAEGAGNNKESHEKYFVKPEEIHGEANPNESEEAQYLNGYGVEFQQPADDSDHVTVDGNQFAYGQEFSYSLSNEGSDAALIYNAPQKPTQISCWTCDASNWNECAQVGFLQACDAQVTACSITTRMRNGEARSISAGCKAKDACESDKLNNFAIFGDETPQVVTSGHQCRPDAQTGPSVCRQCCYSNNCNFMLDFVDELGWSQVLF